MKKFYLFYGLIISLSMFSCAKEESYSCNKEVDAWVKEHLDEVRSMTRSEWNELDPAVSRACYIAFTPQQKARFWDLKMQQVLALEWTEAERTHIAELRSFIRSNPYIFEPEKLYSDELYDKFDRFMYEWNEKAQSELGWSKQLVGAIAASGYDIVNKTGTARIGGQTDFSPRWGNKIPDCNCNKNHDFCDGNTICTDDPCTESYHGCGWVWTQKCDGLCGMK